MLMFEKSTQNWKWLILKVTLNKNDKRTKSSDLKNETQNKNFSEIMAIKKMNIESV